MESSMREAKIEITIPCAELGSVAAALCALPCALVMRVSIEQSAGAADEPQPRGETCDQAPPPDTRDKSGTVASEIYDLLNRRGPLMSGDIIRRLPARTPACIYSTLHLMRRSGEIESRDNPAGSGKINALVDRNGAAA